MQSMMEESAERAEHQRIKFAEKIATLDERNHDLTNELRQQMVRNERNQERIYETRKHVSRISENV